jgi:hypothetical protein
MNYFLLANNKDLSEITINKLNLNIDKDCLVLFNFLFPLKFHRIKNYPNKICISRRRPVKDRLDSKILPGIKEYYCNMGFMRENQHLFKEIYFLGCPHNMGNNFEDYNNHINLFNFDQEKIKCIDYNPAEMAKRLNYHRTGIKYEVSTGIIVNEYLQNIKKIEDNVILVAFNSGLTNFHDKEWETEYFQQQIVNKKCYCIDSYGICNI